MISIAHYPQEARTEGAGTMRPSRRAVTRVVAGLAAAVAGGGAVPAGAGNPGFATTWAAWPGEQLDSFAGSCSARGTDTFTPPVTNAAQQLSVSYDAVGTCTGTLDGATVSNAPVEVHMTARSYGSCSQARATGQSAVIFADGTTIRSAVDYTSMLTEINLTYHGERSGLAHGHATSLTSRTPPDVALKCAREGDAQIPLDLSLTTDSPLVSHRASGPAGPSPSSPRPSHNSTGASVPRARLRLIVRPQRARVGRRRTFSFRVATAHDHPVSGAVVRFAGRRARTGHKGVARMIVKLRRPGRDTARATKPGFHATQHTVLVRPRR